MRVGTRRLRSCLSLMAPFGAEGAARPGDRGGQMARRAPRQGARLGRVRRPRRCRRLPRGSRATRARRLASSALRERAARRRRAARNDARAAVASPRFQRLLLAAGLVCATPQFGSREPRAIRGSERADQPSARRVRRETPRAAPSQVCRSRRHARACGNEERHAARIAAKRLRYVAEFFAAALPGQAHARLPRDARRGAGRARPVQRRRDRRRARERALRARPTTRRPAPCAAGSPRKRRPSSRDLAKAVRRFNAAKPFWPPK